MPIERLNFSGSDLPYSQAVRVGGFVYTAGASIGDPGDDTAAQTRKTLDYLIHVLEQSGTDKQHIVKANVYLSDIGNWGEFNDVWKRYFPTDKPVRTTTEVGKFANHILIEIDFIAVMPGS